MVIEKVEEEVEWRDYMDAKVMRVMLKVEGDVLAITTEEPSDPSASILHTDGQLSNWTWVGFSNSMKKMSYNANSNVLFNDFNKMNYDLAYFDVSHNIEILHLNDSNEFENEINKQLEKKIEPMEPILETINLGNDENPRLIKIGLTLNEGERDDEMISCWSGDAGEWFFDKVGKDFLNKSQVILPNSSYLLWGPLIIGLGLGFLRMREEIL